MNKELNKIIEDTKKEKEVGNLFKKHEKETAKYIKSLKLQINVLDALHSEKKHLKSSEILFCIG